MLKKDKDFGKAMTSRKILITGGAGFIGSKLSEALVKRGENVRILDNFSTQVHSSESLNSSIHGKAELIKGDIRDRKAIKKALVDVDCVVHFAAETGTGQSMYEIQKYYDVNVLGTAILLDVIQNDPAGDTVKSIVLASSRAIYGEGAYRCALDGIVYPEQRTKISLSKGEFEPVCPICDGAIVLERTTENALKKSMSMYALTKQAQEEAIHLFSSTFKRDINFFSLRYQNVFGPGQSLKNPYTGILAIFSNLARQDAEIEIYEDGKESRDFIYIDDVVEATIKCIRYEGKHIGPLNIGSGEAVSVIEVAEMIKKYFNSKSRITISGAFRLGDIRHNIADISHAASILSFKPRVTFQDGLKNFLTWAEKQNYEEKSAYEQSVKELTEKGLMGSRSE